jgi:DNA-binding transcriptional MerR regulator
VGENGYRLYQEGDLARLQQVLFFRELEFPLEDIRRIMSSPAFDQREALIAHRRLLREKRARLDRLIASVERTIESMERGERMNDENMFEGFDDAKIKEYTEEARQRWGGTDAFEESVRRTKRYGKSDWEDIGSKSGEINNAMVALMGRDPADPEVQQTIGRWFKLIDERFYTVTPEIFRGLGDAYVQDARFTASYDQYKPGLAAFMREAMHVYADRLEGKE